jgi:putative ABC transport system substrate-binding protein
MSPAYDWKGDRLVDRRTFVAVAGVAAWRSSRVSLAQVPRSPRRIGFLTAFARADTETFVGLLRPELEKLGWNEGRNVVYLELRSSEGRNERLPSMAVELVAQAPDVILVQAVPAARAAMQATRSIPIVLIGLGNPVESGIVASLVRPGGNVTGSSYLADESVLKLLQLLKEAAPRVRSVALFVNPSNDAATALVRRFRDEVAAYGMRLQAVEVKAPGDFEAAFESIRREGTESILLPPEALIRGNRAAIAAFAQAHRLPLAITGSSIYLAPGALLSYGPTTDQYAQLTARYVDRILKGANPGDLPVEQPSRFELAVSLKTAHAIGLAVPESLLQRADRIVR